MSEDLLIPPTEPVMLVDQIAAVKREIAMREAETHCQKDGEDP